MFSSAFMNGFARAIDLGATKSHKSNQNLLSKSDCEALNEDWKIVGQDLKFAMKEYEDGKTTTTK
jgi:hypothetical protein